MVVNLESHLKHKRTNGVSYETTNHMHIVGCAYGLVSRTVLDGSFTTRGQSCTIPVIHQHWIVDARNGGAV